MRAAVARAPGRGGRPGRGAGRRAATTAQSLAYAARARGLACEVFMPEGAPLSKAAAVRGFGGTVHLGGESVDACVARARERAEATGAVFVHPFDDAEIVAGQGTLGLELLDEVDDLALVVVPVGGGGLMSGVAGVIRAARPGVRIVGVQAEACSAYPASIADGAPVEVAAGPTIADGIAIKRPGRLTLPLVAEWVDEFVTVAEDDIADAMVMLLERAKLVVEGGGAVGIAALRTGLVRPAPHGSTVVVLSGGNVDAGVLAGDRAPQRDRPGAADAAVHADRRPAGRPRAAARPGRGGRRQPRDGQPPARGGPAARPRDRRRPRARDAGAGARRGDRRRPPPCGLRRRALRRVRVAAGAGAVNALAAPGSATALAERLRRPRFEILPLDGIEEQVLAHLATDVTVTVTASPSKGLEGTLALSERLARAGYPVVPHLSARLVRDGAQLEEVCLRLLEAGVRELFVPAGDAAEPGAFPGAFDLLSAMGPLRERFDGIGITGYPESHHLISDEETIQAMFAKAPMATCIISQLCFDADVIARWIAEVRRRGTALPVWIGMPGNVDYAKLVRISMKIGLGESARFLRLHRNWMSRLMTRQFKPDPLLRGLAPTLADPVANVAGFHIYTFNEVARTERWRRQALERLESGARWP